MDSRDVIRSAVGKIVRIPTGTYSRAQVVLVLLGNKPATEMYLPKASYADGVVRTLQQIGLYAEVSTKTRSYGNDSVDVLVARSLDLIEELRITYSFTHHERYGQLMGYPQSAINAFIEKDGYSRVPYEEQMSLLPVTVQVLGGCFAFSRQNLQAELELTKKQIKLIAIYAPILFLEQFGSEKGMEYILESLRF